MACISPSLSYQCLQAHFAFGNHGLPLPGIKPIGQHHKLNPLNILAIIVPSMICLVILHYGHSMPFRHHFCCEPTVFNDSYLRLGGLMRRTFTQASEIVSFIVFNARSSFPPSSIACYYLCRSLVVVVVVVMYKM